MKFSNAIALPFLVAASLSMSACAEKTAEPKAEAKVAAQAPAATVADNAAVEFTKIDVKVGEGAEAQAGQAVSVHYTGWLYDPAAEDKHGTKFDSSRDRGDAFVFPLGAGRVIPGWDQGVVGMKVGGQRTLIIPANMAYGARGAGGVIPPNATLIFDVELMGIQ